jgi:malonyl-CoA decarboxylase
MAEANPHAAPRIDAPAATTASTSREVPDDAVERLDALCRLLMANCGDDRAIGIAEDLAAFYRGLDGKQRARFFELLLDRYAPHPEQIVRAARAYEAKPSYETHEALRRAVESPRQQLFRGINIAPEGLSTLVQMRADLMQLSVPQRVRVRPVNQDLKRLLTSWFNRGFLTLRAIDWNSPASLLEKLIAYEAVHQIRGWDDLRGRLEQDRRCFAFFHPSMPNDPLVFVEVALTQGIPERIGPLIAAERRVLDVERADTATFYSISNCHEGLFGIAFGGFLIKTAVHQLQKSVPHLKTFCTLSPLPMFRTWLQEKGDPTETACAVSRAAAAVQQQLTAAAPNLAAGELDTSREPLLSLCAHYLLHEKMGRGPLDPVARFHLGNGASLARLNWLADLSPKGLEQSAGIMVNYLYRLEDLQANREAHATEGKVCASEDVTNWATALSQPHSS